ncbi:MAG: hypothetical protein M3P37_09625, partial [Actinomycetota bacterium]|nr:hypothetical protein [Actinomycetota bacterium]
PGSDRRFVPGVTAGIYRRPIDRPNAETHPPKNSMNVFLVNSPEGTSSSAEPWRFAFFWLLLPNFHGFLLAYPSVIDHQCVFL